MVKVNLLPPEERTKKQVIKENLIAIFLSLLTFSILFGFSFFLIIYESGELAGKLKNVETEIDAQKQKNDEHKDIEGVISNLNTNIDRIKKLQKKNPSWSVILEEIRTKSPVELTLQELSVSTQAVTSQKSSQSNQTNEPQEKNNQTTENQGSPQQKNTNQPVVLTIKGLSDTQSSVAKFKESLSTSSLFDYVDFESSSWQQEKNKYEFILKLKLKT